MKPILEFKEEKRDKNNIYASDYGKLGIDIILSLRKVEKTNVKKWNDTLRLEAGKAIELQMVKILKDNQIIDKDYSQEDLPSTVIEREGVTISMKFDAVVKKGGATLFVDDNILPKGETLALVEGEPIEVKSINNKNSFDIQSYIENKPRESYVGQLAIYMDALGKERGNLFVSSIDGLHYFWFVCVHKGDKVYQCGDVVIDLKKEYARFKELNDVAFSQNEIPEKYWNEEIYKIPIEQIDWTQYSVSKIGDARNNKCVIGSENKWKIDYSEYKNLILEHQKVGLGYSDEELEIIREKTKGFSSKKK